jgi:two-component system response regulator (stage 0 sporulation protein A)
LARFRRTLIVEQKDDYVKQIKEMLREESASFLCTTDGGEALELYDRYHPDLVLVEAILPGYDGFELMEHMLPERDVVKIVLTAMNRKLIIKKAFELGAAYVIVKPYVKKYFVQRVLEAADTLKKRQNIRAESDQLIAGKISVALKRLGIPVNIKGYKLLREALLTACMEPAKMRPFNVNIYMPLAKKYGSTAKCVERNIRHAIETAAIRGDAEAFYEYFGYTISSEKGKPTNGEFIATLAEKILSRYE